MTNSTYIGTIIVLVQKMYYRHVQLYSRNKNSKYPKIVLRKIISCFKLRGHSSRKLLCQQYFSCTFEKLAKSEKLDLNNCP